MEVHHTSAGICADTKFVSLHTHDDPAALRLKYLGRAYADPAEKERMAASILQVECRQRYSRKFPEFLSEYPSFLFPSRLAAEQASHLWISRWHARIADRYAGDSAGHQVRLADLTAGLGVDFIHMAREFSTDGDRCVALEIDAAKTEALRHNLTAVGLTQAEVAHADSIGWLASQPEHSIGMIFADPARRDGDDSRIFDPRRCMPDVVGRWESLLSRADTVIVKNSPMLDLSMAGQFYPGTMRIIVASVRNECKEVLAVAREGEVFEGIECVNIIGAEGDAGLTIESFFIPAGTPGDVAAELRLIGGADELMRDDGTPMYLYEPNASVMKAMPWRQLCEAFAGMKKLSPNCHLFVSDEFHADFPGRGLRITGLPDRAARKRLKGARLNVATRNHPLPARELANSLRIRQGGDDFLYGAAVGRSEAPVLILASPV